MKLFILSFLFPVFVLGASTDGCLSRMAKDTATPEQKVVIVMMECNNMFLKGQFKFMRAPSKTLEGNNAMDMARGLMDYAACEDMTRLVKQYMKECNGN